MLRLATAFALTTLAGAAFCGPAEGQSLFAGLGGAESAPPIVAGADTTLSAYEDGYFELFVERMADRSHLVTLVDEDGRVLIPLGSVLAHVAIPAALSGDSLVLEWPPEIWRTVVDVSGRSVANADSVTRYDPDEWVVRQGELYLSARALANILHADVAVRFSDLMIVVSGQAAFPSILRARDEAARERVRPGQALSPTDPFEAVPYPDRTGGMAGSWGLSLADGGGAPYGTYRLAMGGSVLGGATEAGVSGLVSESESARATDLFVRHTRVFLGTPWARRLDLGSVVTEGTVARRVTGFTLTNAPLTTPAYFGEAVIAPAVPAGWEYEVYQGEYLVGVSRADSPSQIQAPIGYGNTPLRVRLIGPAGQESEQELVYVVPAARVQTGTWRYAVGGGACRDAVCNGYWFGQVSRGITNAFTAGVGADYLHGDAVNTLRPYAQIGVAPRPNLSLELQARPSSYLRAGARWVHGQSATAGASYTWAGGDTPDIGFAGWTGQLSGGGRVPGFDGRWVSGRLLLRGLAQSDIDAWQASLSTTIRRTHLSLGAESGLQPGTLGTVRVLQTMLGRRPSWADDLSATAALGVGSQGLELGEIGAAIRTLTHTQVDARVRFRKGQDAMLTIGASVRSGLGFFQARGSQSASGTNGYVGADGGLSYGRMEGWSPATTTTVGMAGVAGRAFHDLNGDGDRQFFEPPAVDAVVLVNGRRARTGPDGRFQVWGVTPYEGVAVSVDPLSLDLGWAYTEPDVLVRPTPNMFTRLDLAIGATREVIGRVDDRGDESRPLGGVLIEIIDEDGAVVADARTFSDGIYYVESISSGRYRARIATPSIPRLDGQDGGSGPSEVAFVVPRTPGDPITIAPLAFYR